MISQRWFRWRPGAPRKKAIPLKMVTSSDGGTWFPRESSYNLCVPKLIKTLSTPSPAPYNCISRLICLRKYIDNVAGKWLKYHHLCWRSCNTQYSHNKMIFMSNNSIGATWWLQLIAWRNLAPDLLFTIIIFENRAPICYQFIYIGHNFSSMP